MEKLIERIIDKSIFKEKVKARVPIEDSCPVCKGSTRIRVANEYEMVCPKCKGKGFLPSDKMKEVDVNILSVPMFFESRGESIISISASYEEEGKMINLSIKPEDIINED